MSANKDGYSCASASSCRHDKDESFLQGVKDCAPTLLGYLGIGFASGVVQYTFGLSVVEIVLMSLLLYAGSAQFIAAGMLAASMSPASIILTVLFVNLRHLLLSAALSPYFQRLSPWKNMLIGSLLTDETFGVAINKAARKKQLGEKWMHGLNITAYINWLIANIAGAYMGQWIADPQQLGLDFALLAMFIGILTLTLLSRNQWLSDGAVMLSAAFITVIVSIAWSGSAGVIAAAVAASTIGMVIERWK